MSAPPPGRPEGVGLAAARAAGRPAVGTWLKLDTSETVEIAAAAGLDFVVVDLEHAMVGTRTLSAMLAIARARGVDALVRVPDHAGPTATVVLDHGAAGIVVPGVDDEEQARAAVAVARFPPLGSRGVSTSARAGGWGALGPQEYTRSQDERTVVYVQVESPAAVGAAARIAAVPGVDGLLVGPVDLAVSSGADGGPDLPALLERLERTCAEHDVFLGTAAGPDPQQARALVARGYRMLAMSNDATMLRVAASALRDAVLPRPAPATGPVPDGGEPSSPGAGTATAGVGPAERRAVEELVLEFARRVDRDAAVDNELLFAPDARFTYDGRSNRGRADIRAAYDVRRARGERTARHVFTNLVVRRDGRGALRGCSTMLLFGADGPPPIASAAPIVVADVEDEYVAVEGRLLFAERVITPVFVDPGRPAVLPLGDRGAQVDTETKHFGPTL